MDGRPKRIKMFAFTIVCVYDRLRLQSSSCGRGLKTEVFFIVTTLLHFFLFSRGNRVFRRFLKFSFFTESLWT